MLASSPVVRFVSTINELEGGANVFMLLRSQHPIYKARLRVRPANGGPTHDFEIGLMVLRYGGDVRKSDYAFMGRVDQATWRIESGSWCDDMPRMSLLLAGVPDGVFEIFSLPSVK